MTAYRSFAEQELHYFIRPHEEIPASTVSHPANWYGPEMAADPALWLVELSPDEVTELAAAARRARQQGIAPAGLTRDNFPLPGLADRLSRWRQVLSSGRGFLCLRGLPVDAWGDELASYVYWGLGHQLGAPGAQNAAEELLGHVTDYGEEADNPAVRRYRTSGNIDFHCDAADVVGLLCLRTARRGGQSRIASSVTIFNEILAKRPDLVPRLFQPFRLDRRGEEGEGEAPTLDITPCAFAGGQLRTFWHSEYFRSAVRHPGVPPFTAEEQALLELYDRLAASPEIYLDMWLQPGDIQLISNHTVVHARTAYEDYPESARRRHLLRLWLSLE
jgi:hypothetical protein